MNQVSTYYFVSSKGFQIEIKTNKRVQCSMFQ